MNDASFVRCRQRIAELPGNIKKWVERKSVFRDQMVKRLAFHKLHGKKMNAVRLFDGKYSDNSWMIKRCECSRFALETLEACGIGCGLGREHLESDAAVKFCVCGAEYLAH